MLDAAEVIAMQAAIMTGRAWPAGILETAEHRAVWDRIAADLAAIAAAGMAPDLPAELNV